MALLNALVSSNIPIKLDNNKNMLDRFIIFVKDRFYERVTPYVLLAASNVCDMIATIVPHLTTSFLLSIHVKEESLVSSFS